VAGPIERATQLLPQMLRTRTFNYGDAVDGLRQMLWGFCKKMLVADTCAMAVDIIWQSPGEQSALALVVGAFLFTIQIYGDFSGYSDIAIGTAKLFGIRLMRNFNNPYFSRDIAEFWRRWHISLTTWFRDYVYIPLGGSRVSKAKIVRNTFIIFLVSGFWHGANWTFLAWGAYHAILFLPLILLGRNRKYTNTVAEGKILPSAKEVLQMTFTFALAVIGWVFFRADTISQAWHYLARIPHGGTPDLTGLAPLCLFILIMLTTEWFNRSREHGLDLRGIKSHPLKFTIYYLLIFLIFLSYNGTESFIYFQF
jgi:D-alanyl-lipoteichoic acid acyltransferase DltB (MBOAT superfamily)